jgi:hypothetical protein
MMDTRFIEIDPSEVQSGFPKFYHEQGWFFEIIHRDQPIGFVGVRPLEKEGECELEAFIFKRRRNALTKGIVLATLDLPKSLGFKRCVMKTSLSRVVKLLNSMGKYGIIPVSVERHSPVFVRKFE